MLSKLFGAMHTKAGQMLISIILGIGLASLFRKTCTNKSCYKFIGPQVKKVTDNTYIHDNDCYKFSYNTQQCKSENPIELE